jgi:spore coat protein U-like protein
LNIFTKTALVATLITTISPIAASAASPLIIPLNASATVIPNCHLKTVGDLDMGNYDPFAVAPLHSNTTVEANCTKGSELTIKTADTYLTHGTYAYHLLLNLSFSNPGIVQTILQDGHGLTKDNDVKVYGTIPAHQNAWVGHYTDGGRAVVSFNF